MPRLAVVLSAAVIALLLFADVCEGTVYSTQYGFNYHGQYTGPYAGYYGWKGVKGGVYWHNAPSLPLSPIEPVHVDSYLGMSVDDGTTFGDWIQGGYTCETYSKTVSHTFWENYLNGLQYFDFEKQKPIPSHEYVRIQYVSGPDSRGLYKWELWFGDGFTKNLYMSEWSGRAQAMSEAYNYGAWSIPATARFGSDTSTYNGTSHALYLKNGSLSWELWDSSLTASGTYIDRFYDPPYHYSDGYHFYYFGTNYAW